VRWTELEEQLAPASTLAEALGLALVLAPALVGVEVEVVAGVDDELLLQAASSDKADAPAITGSVCRDRVLICA
jgi:hypothetical protein